MAGRARTRMRPIDYWPGFVDALSTMLLVIIFLLSVFMLAQFFLAREVTGKDTALTKLNRQIEELSQLLALERSSKTEAEGTAALLSSNLEAAQQDKARMQGLIDADKAGASGAEAAGALAAAEQQKLAAQQDLSAKALAQVDILNQQIAALRRQLGAVEQALDASEKSDVESQAKIADLGSRLNVALAQKVQELARYRSDFFGRLRQILGDRPGVSVVGDRFIFQSEVLFESSQANLDPAGRTELDKLASALIELDHRNSARHSLDRARRRPHRQKADPVGAVSLELVAVLRARNRRCAISDFEGRSAAAARRRRLWRIPADRPRRQR